MQRWLSALGVVMIALFATGVWYSGVLYDGPSIVLSALKGTIGKCKNSNSTHNFLVPSSGCWISDWVIGNHDCCAVGNDRRLTDVSLLGRGNTVYVEMREVRQFVKNILPKITVPIILITGQQALIKCCDQIDARGFGTDATAKILENDYILHWYTMNPWFRHPKVSGWPFGIKYSDAYATAYSRPKKKTHTLFLSHLGIDHRPWRIGVPRGPPVSRKKYVDQLSHSRYILSPNGDRPDCYRNYEALGLGAVPVTQLDSKLYDFMAGSGLLFEQDLFGWKPPLSTEHTKSPCRNVVLKSYWARLLAQAVKSKNFTFIHDC